MEKDPHIHFAHGGQADFRGRDGQLYAFLSAPGLAVKRTEILPRSSRDQISSPSEAANRALDRSG